MNSLSDIGEVVVDLVGFLDLGLELAAVPTTTTAGRRRRRLGLGVLEIPGQPRPLLLELGDLYRSVLATSGRQVQPLRDEIAFLDRYLGIEKLRMQERLQIEFLGAPEFPERKGLSRRCRTATWRRCATRNHAREGRGEALAFARST